MALMNACALFRPELGFRFSTYAVRAIDSRLQRAIDNQRSTVRVPCHVRVKIRRVVLARERLGKEASLEALSEATRLSVVEVRWALAVEARREIHLDRPAGDGEEDGATLADSLAVDREPAPVSTVMARDVKASVRKALEALRPRDRRVLQALHLEERTRSEVAREFGVTTRRVDQIEKRARSRLRYSMLLVAPDINGTPRGEAV
jgi:RNA polymerase sigma factor (sigma-70 family)